jgi:hypothetical protein
MHKWHLKSLHCLAQRMLCYNKQIRNVVWVFMALIWDRSDTFDA